MAEFDSLGLYLQDIGKHTMLEGREEERELAQTIEQGIEARAQLSHLEERAAPLGGFMVRRSHMLEASRFIDETLETVESPEQKEIILASPYFNVLRNALELREDIIAAQREAKDGEEAKQRFIEANLRLVVSIAKRYPIPVGWELLDLIQEGNLGLEHAVDKFDWRRNNKFSTYATWWIRQGITRALNEKVDLINIPGDKVSRLRTSMKESRRIHGDETHGLTEDEKRLHRLRQPLSLNRPVGENEIEHGELLASDISGPEEEVMEISVKDSIDNMLSTLDPRARYILERRYGLIDGEGKTLKEIAEELGVTSEAVRRLIFRAESFLKEEFDNSTNAI